MKKSIDQIISDAAKAAVGEVIRQQRRNSGVNYYRATERLLRAYPKLRNLVEHPDEYGFVPPGKSKSITVAPPAGSGVKDKDEIIADAIDQRIESYKHSCAQFAEINAVVSAFANREDFGIIRMYYFGETFDGDPRPENSRRYTWEEIAEELEKRGIVRSERALRTQRTKLVQEMCVCLFGVDGAVSVESRRDQQKEAADE